MMNSVIEGYESTCPIWGEWNEAVIRSKEAGEALENGLCTKHMTC